MATASARLSASRSGGQPGDGGLVLRDHRPLLAAHLGPAERVGDGAAQPLRPGQRGQHRLAPRAELHLVLHAHRPEHRRVQAPRDLRARPADRLVLGPGLRGQQQPGHLVLVLVRHQLVAVAGDRGGERRARRVDPSLGVAGDADEVEEALRRSARTGSRRGRRRAGRSARRASRASTSTASPAACSTSVGNAAHRRPQRNAATLRSTATPLSSIARSIAPGRRRSPPAARRRRAAGCWPSWRRRTARSPARRCRRSGCARPATPRRAAR